MKSIPISDSNAGQSSHRKGHRRQESMYTMTGLYSENIDDNSSIDVPADSENSENGSHVGGHSMVDGNVVPNYVADTVIKCHSRQPSTGIIDQRDKNNESDDIDMSADCGILTCRPKSFQKFARIKIFVLLLSMLVTLQQALSSGYINSVITTIEKRFEIPSSYSGLIASSYEIGNVITVIFVSYLGSRRHIPVWIGIGAIIMGIGSLIFMVPHFTGEANPGISSINDTSDNICRSVPSRELDLVDRLSNGLSNSPLVPHNNLRGDNCIKGRSSTFGPVLLFVIAQMLLGCGGSPLFTLGTTYVDDHVRTESASIYIGFMYSFAAFGPVLGFLLGAYLLSFHMDSFSGTLISIDPGDRRWVGMWWGGFLLCGLLLLLVAVPFFSFPKVLTREKKKLRSLEEQNLKSMTANNSNSLQRQQQQQTSNTKPAAQTQNLTGNGATSPSSGTSTSKVDSGYGKDIKDIPLSMWRLVSNPIYICTCLGACMELMIVSGFIVFLPKYLETQFSLGKSQASVFTGSIAVPGACIGIFLGGCFLKKFELKPKGAVQFVLVSNLICLACYGLLFFLGCDNLKMAGTTIPYYNSTTHTPEPFQVNLTAACNFGCECHMTDVEPVCGNNGLTYFSPCHAGCTAFSSSSNYTNCACVQSNQPNVYKGVGGSEAQPYKSDSGIEEFAEVTVVPVASAGPCISPCRTIYPFLILLFFMTFIVASTQMPLLMIVLRSVSEEERSFALGMQFVIFRLFGYIPAPILFGNLIDSTCLLWKSTCGEKGGRCLIYDIETFRYKYVGLCATIKLVALAIFIIDWWLVHKKKQLEYTTPLSPAAGVGSIISLDKLFVEKGVIDNNQAGSYANDVMADECSVDVSSYDINNKQVLIASRHMRNDSKGIQLEFRYDNYNDGNPEIMKKRKQHIRSNSCDVKIGRSNSREYDSEYRNRRLFHNRSHSRTNSRDLDFDARQRRHQTHSRTNSRDEHMNIKYILNCLKPDANTNKILMTSAAMMATAAVAPRATAQPRGHRRNHSYDQIYSVPNNIKIDHELHNKLFKNRNRAQATVPAIENDVAKTNASSTNANEYLDNRNLCMPDQANAASSSAVPAPSHSRNNSKDLNKSFLSSLADDATNILRHRRTNSKDLNRILSAMPSTSAAVMASDLPNSSNNKQQQHLLQHSHPQQSQQQQNHHKRNLSQPQNEFPEENSADVAAQVLLLGNRDNSDIVEIDRQNH